MWIVVAPAIFTRFSTFGLNIISQAFVGHIGPRELAAFALVFTILLRFANGVLHQRQWMGNDDITWFHGYCKIALSQKKMARHMKVMQCKGCSEPNTKDLERTKLGFQRNCLCFLFIHCSFSLLRGFFLCVQITVLVQWKKKKKKKEEEVEEEGELLYVSVLC
ncbi:hypothetical protein VNO80_19460 [Phaseolus coccineus]|uniref:Uncharacterized protein n=1 Tax=Phaseolus coccineus TaxID=3886 RepID=A0AAN9R0N5_PHACN